MKKFLKAIIFISIFISTTFITIGAGYYKKATALEQAASFKITLNKEISSKNNNAKPTTINITKAGLPKQLIQPNVQSIKGTITNNTKDNISIKLVYRNFKGKISVSSKTNASFGLNGNLNITLKNNQQFAITVLIDIPRGSTNKYLVEEGYIDIVNLKNNEVIGSIPIVVINSNLPK